MAYTIISQNNSTTTLSDGVNTITVPSRVNLTSGNFTIVEVNNNMATLEDGDGNVYRDIPCVATLVDAGGGSSLPDQTGHSGEFLTTDGTDASWAAVDALPSQTGNSGKFLTTDGSSASWSDKPLVNKSTDSTSVAISDTQNTTARSVILGIGTTASANWATVVGPMASSTKQDTVVIGNGSTAKAQGVVAIGATSVEVTGARSIAIQSKCVQNPTLSAADTICLGGFYNYNNIDNNSFYVGLDYTDVTKKFKLLSSDGTIPTARLTKVNTTITIAVADWNGGTTVTKTVNGITATGVVMVAPDPTDQAAYTSAGILCTAQAADSLTFTCSTTPTADIDVNVVML